TLDRYGHRLDEVDFHPSWQELLGIALNAGLHSSPWADPKRGAHVARAAGTYMLGQIESGVYCPLAMTYGSVPTLRHAPAIAADFFAQLRPELSSGPAEKRGARRHGYDRKPGWLGPAHKYNARGAHQRRQFPPSRPQMVHVGADVRCFFDPRAVAQGPELFPV